MSSSVEKIKERLSISDVVSSYIKLEKAGINYKAKCPFHNEKTASFFVSPDRGTYYCFGCGAKGDIFSFVEQFEGLEFKQALESLATKAGIELVPERADLKNEREKLFQAVELATEFFESELAKNSKARDYLAGRGLTEETISKWRVGFAPAEWRSLHDYLLTKKVAEVDMYSTGLIKKSDSTEGQDRSYDVFRGRIMFPIFDSVGRPVAFSGRILVDDNKSPKYLNSPATKLFNKSEVLYGFDRAKTAIRKMDYSILVEGQMDLILSHQAGLSNTVASSGTALTENHLRRLQRISPRIMFAFDADGAGFNATKRSSEMALSIGMEVKVAVLPAGEDPASLVAKNPNLWKQTLKSGRHIVDFYLDNVLSRKLESRLLSREIRATVLPAVLKIESKTEQAHFVKLIAERSGLKEEAVWDDLKTIVRGESGSVELAKARAAPFSRRQAIERRLLGVIYWQESKNKNTVSSAIRKRFVDRIGEDLFKSAEERIGEDREKVIFEAEQYYEESGQFEKEIDELLINLEEEILRESLVQKMSELHLAEIDKDQDRAKKILTEYTSVMNSLNELKKKKI